MNAILSGLSLIKNSLLLNSVALIPIFNQAYFLCINTFARLKMNQQLDFLLVTHRKTQLHEIMFVGKGRSLL
jgi:hypothetical protein